MMFAKTNNISFKKMRAFLQNAYVENNEFMMQVNNEQLQNFNLASLYEMEESERKEMINIINKECDENVWFFFREILPDITTVNEDDHLYNLSELPRFRLNILSMIMIYMYANNKSFAVQRMYEKSIQDKEAMNIADKTLAMLALYEFLFKSNNPTFLAGIAQHDDTIWSYIINQYNRIMDVLSKGILSPTDIISSDKDYLSSYKFFEIGIESEPLSIDILNDVKYNNKLFFGVIDHIFDASNVITRGLDKVSEENRILITYAIKELISNNFSYRFIKSDYISSIPNIISDKYYYDRIFDNQGPLPHNENIITVL